VPFTQVVVEHGLDMHFKHVRKSYIRVMKNDVLGFPDDLTI
jgi:hypothetical protein